MGHSETSVGALWAALWECFLASGSGAIEHYAYETQTVKGRADGLLVFMREGNPQVAVDAVRELRKDYDEAGEAALKGWQS